MVPVSTTLPKRGVGRLPQLTTACMRKTKRIHNALTKEHDRRAEHEKEQTENSKAILGGQLVTVSPVQESYQGERSQLAVLHDVPLQIGACPDHCPLTWHVLVDPPTRMYPL